MLLYWNSRCCKEDARVAEVRLAQENWPIELALLVSVYFLCLVAHVTIHEVVQGVLVL